jgi:hypothetical protein
LKVKRLLPQAKQFVRGALSRDACRWHSEKVLNQIPRLLERLSKGIPPNEVVLRNNEMSDGETYGAEAGELPAILIAGWMYETYWQQKYRPDAKMMGYETMSRLLLKACEDIHII